MAETTITDEQLQEKVREKRREAGLPEDPASASDSRGGAQDGKLGEAIAGWAETEEREIDCAAGRPGCEGRFTQSRPKIHKGRAWKQPICPSCQGQLDQAVAQSEAEERRARSLDSRLAVLEVPPAYADASFETFEFHGDEENQVRQRRIVNACRRVVDEWPDVPGIMLFMGGYGTGKGHLAWSIAKQIITEKGEAVRFASLPALIRELREGWSHPAAEPESIVLARYQEPPLLVIDEISRHAYYGEPTPHLYELVNHRLNWRRPTILTTNEDIASLGEALSGPLLSRIEGENAIWGFGEVDYRKEAKRSWL